MGKCQERGIKKKDDNIKEILVSCFLLIKLYSQDYVLKLKKSFGLKDLGWINIVLKKFFKWS